MRSKLRRIGRLADRVKRSWDWVYFVWSLLGAVGVAPVVLGYLAGAPVDVIALYLIAGIAFAVVLVIEGRQVLRPRPSADPEPTFEILYSGADPQHNYVEKVQTLTTRIFRIGIRNRSGMTIRRVNVEVTKVEPVCPPGLYLPARLRLSTEAILRRRRPEQSRTPWSKEFPLDAGETKLVDVLAAQDGANNGFVICDLGENWRLGFQPGHYRLTVFVHGHDARSVQAVFAFGRNGDEAIFTEIPAWMLV
jgi:hypothetical protein